MATQGNHFPLVSLPELVILITRMFLEIARTKAMWAREHLPKGSSPCHPLQLARIARESCLKSTYWNEAT